MLSEERQKQILSMVTQNRSVTMQALMEGLGASGSTIRRDLQELDGRGLLTKVRGGAIAKGVVFNSKDSPVPSRMEHNRDAKILIAQYAAALIEPEDFVYLDAGTTTELMVDFITCRSAVFVTNGFAHAHKLSERGFLTYILGGEVKLPTEAVVGEEALRSLDKYHFTKGFWGTNGITPSGGFSTPDVREALVKEVAMAHTRQKYVVGDASKFSQISCVTFAAFADATVITAGLDGDSYRQYGNIIEVDKP